MANEEQTPATGTPVDVEMGGEEVAAAEESAVMEVEVEEAPRLVLFAE